MGRETSQPADAVMALMNTLRANDIAIGLDGDQLHIRGKKSALTDALKQAIRDHKQALIGVLRQARELAIPPNAIPSPCEAITPGMLTLVRLGQDDIDRITRSVDGGARNIQDIYPLAPLQEGMLFHHLLSQQGDAYLIPLLLAFDSRKRTDRFLRVLQQIIDRHDILRTSIQWEGLPQAVQVVWRHAPLQVDELELDPAAGPAAGQMIARFDPRHYRIDVHRAPLVRVFVACDQANGRYLLQLLSHHLITDHTTLDLVKEEIRNLLNGGRQPTIQPTPFRHFIAQATLGIPPGGHEAFFRRMLGDVTEPTIPFGLADVQNNGADIDEARRMLPLPLAVRLRQQARKLGITVASLMHLAWAQLLYRVSGQQTVVFGTVLFGRMQAAGGAEPALGMFINTLPLCIRLGAGGAADLARTTHALLAQLLRHEHASLALAQRCSGIAPPAPLFSALLNYRHSAASAPGAAQAHECKGIDVLSSQVRTNYPFSMAVDDLGEDLALTAMVSSTVSARRICAYFHTVLEQLATLLETEAATPVSRIGILPQDELRQLLVGWNATAYPMPETGIVQRFAQRVEQTPHTAALVCQDVMLTFAELDRKSNRLAHHLRRLGVGPDVLVAIAAARSLDMLVAIWGVWKAGGAYVPLDPSSPRARLHAILADARPAALLTQSHLLAHLAAVDLPTCCLDTADQWLAAEDDRAPAAPACLAHLAYVIFTSGSTGQPKGVSVTHRSLANFADVLARQVYTAPGLNLTLNAPYVFDMSLKHIGMLAYGHTLHVLTDEVRLDPVAMARYIEHHRIDGLECTPSQLRLLLDEPQAAQALPHYVLLGGEAIDLATWEALRRLPRKRFINMYGPTEATIDCAMTDLSASQSAVPTIGTPIANAQLYILDEHLAPVPTGCAGELYIAGAGLARAYLNRPALTAERFLPNPFGTSPGARMYRSGDLARYLPNGEIEYVGRVDDQVKIRGYRIELKEIVAALTQLAAVRQAAVIAHEAGPGDNRLVAYIVPEHGCPAAPDTQFLRAALASSLPEYMVPAHFVVLERLPLTQNGKIDRKALPLPDLTRSEAGYVAPRTATQARLCAIWARVLGMDRIGLFDNFFELGGHSLLSIKLLGALRAEMDVTLPLATVFNAPTVAALSAIIESGQHAGSLLVPLHPEGKALPLFCLHPTGGQVFFYQGLAQALDPAIPVYAIQSPEAAGLPLRFASLREMAQHYAHVVVTAQPDGPVRLLGWSTGGLVALAVAAVLEAQGRQIGYLGLLDSNAVDAGSGDDDHAQLRAAATTIAAIRGQTLTRAEIVGIRDLLARERMSARDLFDQAYVSRMLPHLEKWSRQTLSADVVSHLNRQLMTTLRHGLLLAESMPAAIQATVHVMRPRGDHGDTGAASDSATAALISNPANSIHEFVDGDHFEMLRPPHVRSLALRISARLAERVAPQTDKSGLPNC